MNNARENDMSRIIRIGIIAGVLLLAGCMSIPGEPSLSEWVASSPDRVWTPPAQARPQPPAPAKQIDIPADLLQPGTKWRLTDIINIALRNNPDTRAAWYAARSAAADMLSQKGDYYPQIDGTLDVSHLESSYATGLQGKSGSSLEPGVTLYWLLFDFGGRDAAVEEKRQALMAADFTHNAAIQDAAFLVIETYFLYADARATEKAYQISVNDAATNLEAAQNRHREGLATIADVLQAKTAFSQAKLNLETATGRVRTIRGALATAMGLPANTPYDIEELAVNPPVNQAMETVDDYIRQAQVNRPELAAQKSLVEQSLARVRTTRSALYPNLALSNNLSGFVGDQHSSWENQNNTALTVNIPIFHGYSRRYDELRSEQDAEYQKASLEGLEQRIIFQVWSSYFALQTSSQQIRTSNDLLGSAKQSYDVALGRYKAGVGGFLDLLAAQSALENARAQHVTALAGWYTAFARLTRSTGMLWRKPDGQGDILDLFPSPTIKEQQK